jgi:hypothetical protein
MSPTPTDAARPDERKGILRVDDTPENLYAIGSASLRLHDLASARQSLAGAGADDPLFQPQG